jgi:hypothetical protein
MERNFRFAFRLRTDISPFASARDLFCIRFDPKAPGVFGWVAAGTKEPSFAPFRSTCSDTSPVNLGLTSTMMERLTMGRSRTVP